MKFVAVLGAASAFSSTVMSPMLVAMTAVCLPVTSLPSQVHLEEEDFVMAVAEEEDEDEDRGIIASDDDDDCIIMVSEDDEDDPGVSVVCVVVGVQAANMPIVRIPVAARNALRMEARMKETKWSRILFP